MYFKKTIPPPCSFVDGDYVVHLDHNVSLEYILH